MPITLTQNDELPPGAVISTPTVIKSGVIFKDTEIIEVNKDREEPGIEKLFDAEKTKELKKWLWKFTYNITEYRGQKKNIVPGRFVYDKFRNIRKRDDPGYCPRYSINPLNKRDLEFFLITGRPNTGKTYVGKKLAKQIDDKFDTRLFFFDPHKQFYDFFLFTLKNKFKSKLKKGLITEELRNEFLINNSHIPENAEIIETGENTWEIINNKKRIFYIKETIIKKQGIKSLNVYYEYTKPTLRISPNETDNPDIHFTPSFEMEDRERIYKADITHTQNNRQEEMSFFDFGCYLSEKLMKEDHNIAISLPQSSFRHRHQPDEKMYRDFVGNLCSAITDTSKMMGESNDVFYVVFDESWMFTGQIPYVPSTTPRQIASMGNEFRKFGGRIIIMVHHYTKKYIIPEIIENATQMLIAGTPNPESQKALISKFRLPGDPQDMTEYALEVLGKISYKMKENGEPIYDQKTGQVIPIPGQFIYFNPTSLGVVVVAE